MRSSAFPTPHTKSNGSLTRHLINPQSSHKALRAITALFAVSNLLTRPMNDAADLLMIT